MSEFRKSNSNLITEVREDPDADPLTVELAERLVDSMAMVAGLQEELRTMRGIVTRMAGS